MTKTILKDPALIKTFDFIRSNKKGIKAAELMDYPWIQAANLFSLQRLGFIEMNQDRKWVAL
tara:strand:- start:1810 stop:1995 length:186 start_codon:yes stop_codon:yes gene_type:complete